MLNKFKPRFHQLIKTLGIIPISTFTLAPCFASEGHPIVEDGKMSHALVSSRPALVPSIPVGKIYGQIGLDGAGAINYQVPIIVPPGTQGLAPNLALTYSSSNGDGYLGIGWGLSGLTIISRCPKTIRAYNTTSSVGFDLNDRFCLDDNLLIAVNGPYGSDGTQYYTEKQSWTNVTSIGSCGVTPTGGSAGPCSFKVLNRDGYVFDFGSDPANRFIAQGKDGQTVLAWPINKITDQHDNYMQFQYSVDSANGEYFLTGITYTGNAPSLIPQRNVAFSYADRPVQSTSRKFVGGSAVQVTKLLSNIATSVNGGGVLTYSLQYEVAPPNFVNRLVSLTLQDANQVAINSTSFSYQNATTIGFTDSGFTLPCYGCDSAYTGGYVNMLSPFVETGGAWVEGIIQDFNGDGIPDFSKATYFNKHDKLLNEIYIGTGTGQLVQNNYFQPNYTFYLNEYFNNNSPRYEARGVNVDVNGDGLPDYILSLYNELGQYVSDNYVYLNTGSTFIKTVQLPGYLNRRLASTFAYAPAGIFQDLNGDGIADFCQCLKEYDSLYNIVSDKRRIYYGQKGPQFGFHFIDSGIDFPDSMFDVFYNDDLDLGPPPSIGQAGIIADLNIDGLPDFIKSTRYTFNIFDKNLTSSFTDAPNIPGNNNIYLNTGNGYSSIATMPDNKFINTWVLPMHPVEFINVAFLRSYGVVQDINGDGIPDFTRAVFCQPTDPNNCITHNSDKVIYLGQGTGAFAAPDPNNYPELPGYLFLAYDWRDVGPVTARFGILQDFNNDGLPDYIQATKFYSGGGNRPTFDNAVYLGTGKSFVNAASLPSNGFLFQENFDEYKFYAAGIFQDLNGDKIADFSQATNNYVYLHESCDPQPFLDDDFGFDGCYELLTSNLGVFLGLPNAPQGFNFASSFSFPESIFDTLVPTINDQPKKYYQNGFLFDFDGNGILDFTKATFFGANGTIITPYYGTVHNKIYLGMKPVPNLIKNINNGLGGTVDIQYSTLVDRSVYIKGNSSVFPVVDVLNTNTVVKSYTQGDGSGHYYTTLCNYAGAQYDTHYLEWLGFKSAGYYDVNSLINITATYRQDFPYTGRTESSITFATINNQSVINGAQYFGYSDISGIAGIYEPVKVSQETAYHSSTGDPLFSQFANFTYYCPAYPGTQNDLYGNVASVYQWNTLDNIQLYSYYFYLNSPETWQLGKMVQKRISSASISSPFPLPPTNQWDNQLDLAWATASYTPAGDTNCSTVWSNSTQKWMGTTYIFDGYGNLNAKCQSLYGCLASCDNSNPTYTQISYDDTFKTFRTSITSPAGAYGPLVGNFTYEPNFGTVLSFSDSNGNVFSMDVDGFGRIINYYKPHNSPTDAQLFKISNVGFDTNSGKYFFQSSYRNVWESPINPATWQVSRAYFDGMDRKTLEISSGPTFNLPRTISYGYDSVGRAFLKTLPYFNASLAVAVTIDYDNLNRATKITSPDGTYQTIDYNTACTGQEVPKTFCYTVYGAPYERSTQVTLNSQEKITQKILPNGGIITSNYDLLQRKVSETDPQGKVRSSTYDSAGFLVGTNDSDSGLSTFEYDTFGNLLLATDQLGQTIAFQYDTLNRVVKKTSTGLIKTEVTNFNYDEPASSNGRGRLTSVSNFGNSDEKSHYAYNFNYNFDGSLGAISISYPYYNLQVGISYTYGPQGNLLQVNYPDGYMVNLTYNLDGSVAQVTFARPGNPPENIVTYGSYNELGQPLSALIGQSGLNKTFDYYEPGDSGYVTSAIKEMMLRQNAAPLGNKTTYQWDLLGRASNIGFNNVGHAPEYENFAYQANTNFLSAANGTRYVQEFNYDGLGAITQISGPAQEDAYTVNYNTPNNHQVSTLNKISGEVLYKWVFDLKGNLQSKTKIDTNDLIKFEFNPENMLESLVYTSNMTDYNNAFYYNYANARNVKIDYNGHTTFYASPDYEIVRFANGTMLKTIYIYGLSGKIAAYTYKN